MAPPVLRLFFLASACCQTRGLVSLDQASKERQKYLTYKPSDKGFGNRLQTFQIAFILAQQSGRTLISRPFSDHHTGGIAVPYTTYLRPIKPDVLKVVEDSEIPDLGNLSTIDLPLSPWVHCNRDLSQVVQWIKDHNDADVINYNVHFGHWEAMFRLDDVGHIITIMQKHVRLLHDIEWMASALMHFLPTTYDGMHMRLGDKAGNALVNCTKYGLEFNPHDYGCAPKSQRLEDAFEYIFPAEPHEGTVYVATNLPGSPRIKRLRGQATVHNKTVRLWEFFPPKLVKKLISDDQQRFLREITRASRPQPGVPGTMMMRQLVQNKNAGMIDAALWSALSRERSSTLISLIEQLILVHAKTFLPSFISSWDQYVITQRYANSTSEESRENFILARDAIWRRHCRQHES